MKTLFSSLALLFSFCAVIAQSSLAPLWQTAYGGNKYDGMYGCYFRPTADGGYLMAGSSTSVNGDVSGNHGLNDIWLIKVDGTGNLQWQKCYGGSKDDIISTLEETSDGGFLVSATVESSDGDITGFKGLVDAWILKLDKDGNLMWKKTYGGPEYDQISSIVETSTGELLMVGAFGKSGNSDVDFWFVRTDSEGNIINETKYGGSGYDSYNSISAVAGGLYVLGGVTNSTNGDVIGNHGGNDIWVAYCSEAGTISKSRCIGGSDDDYCYYAYGRGATEAMIIGRTTSSDGDISGNHGKSDVFAGVIDLAPGVSIKWLKCYGGSNDDGLHKVSVGGTKNHNVIATSTKSYDGDLTRSDGAEDCWFLQIDGSGGILQQNSFGGNTTDLPYSIAQMKDGSFVSCGITKSSNGFVKKKHSDFDWFLMKLGNGTVDVNNFEGQKISIYPNPVQGELHINFGQISGKHPYKLNDISGKLIRKGILDNAIANLSLEGLENGVYTLEVEGTIKQSFKIVKN